MWSECTVRSLQRTCDRGLGGRVALLCAFSGAMASGCIAFGYGDAADVAQPGGGRRGAPSDDVRPDADREIPWSSTERDGGADGAQDATADAATDGSDRDATADAAKEEQTGGDSGALPANLLSLPSDGELRSICYTPDDCNGDDLLCFGAIAEAPGLCAEDCDEDDDCALLDGLAPTCTNGTCLVNCAGLDGEGDGPCPLHMECRPQLTEFVPGLLTAVVVALTSPNYWCVYPVESGSNDVAALGRCEPDHGDGDCAGTRTCHRLGATGYCTETCDVDGDCTPPPGVSSTPLCAAGACQLDCSGPGATCPAGMNCRDVGLKPLQESYRCIYIE